MLVHGQCPSVYATHRYPSHPVLRALLSPGISSPTFSPFLCALILLLDTLSLTNPSDCHPICFIPHSWPHPDLSNPTLFPFLPSLSPLLSPHLADAAHVPVRTLLLQERCCATTDRRTDVVCSGQLFVQVRLASLSSSQPDPTRPIPTRTLSPTLPLSLTPPLPLPLPCTTPPSRLGTKAEATKAFERAVAAGDR